MNPKVDAYLIDVLAQDCREAHDDPELVRSAPHDEVVHKLADTWLADTPLDDPDGWATTWRAYLRKRTGTPVG